jgi:nicastrin
MNSVTMPVCLCRYVPAYSTRLKWEDGWQLLPLPAGTDSDPDPVYTESFWNQLRLRTYMAESSQFENRVLIAGLVVSGFAYLLQVGAKRVFEHRLKQA